MFTASMVLIMSAAMFMFYLQAICQRVLRREFAESYFQSVVNINRLAFPSVRSEVESLGSPRDFASLRTALQCDFAALTYLLKNTNNASRRYGSEDRLLMAYFRVMFLSLTLRHTFKLSEKSAVVKLTSVLQYFSNVVGQRTSALRLGNLATADYTANS